MHASAGRSSKHIIQSMSIDSDIADIRERQEVHIQMTDALCERVEMLTELTGKLMEWANQPADPALQNAMAELTAAMEALQPPPSGDLAALIRSMTAALQALQTQMVQQGQVLHDLPAAVARAVQAR